MVLHIIPRSTATQPLEPTLFFFSGQIHQFCSNRDKLQKTEETTLPCANLPPSPPPTALVGKGGQLSPTETAITKGTPFAETSASHLQSRRDPQKRDFSNDHGLTSSPEKCSPQHTTSRSKSMTCICCSFHWKLRAHLVRSSLLACGITSPRSLTLHALSLHSADRPNICLTIQKESPNVPPDESADKSRTSSDY